jgi:hypothetical protein
MPKGAAAPQPAKAAAPVEVKIHAPEEYATGGKGKGGKAISKPITRKETKIDRMTWIIGAASCLVVVVVAVVLRGVVPQNPVPYVAVGLLLITPPLVRLGYGFLRDDELEAYTGRPLWIRTAICTAVYMGLWAMYAFVLVPFGLTGEMWQWLFVGPLLVGIGALVAFAVFDLELGSAAVHVGFFLLVTLVLRALIGLEPVWKAALANAV